MKAEILYFDNKWHVAGRSFDTWPDALDAWATAREQEQEEIDLTSMQVRFYRFRRWLRRLLR